MRAHTADRQPVGLFHFHRIRRLPVLAWRCGKKLATAREHDTRRLIRSSLRKNLPEELHGASEILHPIGTETALIEYHPRWPFGSAVDNIQKLVDRKSARASIDHQAVELAHLDAVTGEAARFLSDDDLGAIFLVGAFETNRYCRPACCRN
jgi:hypothetical protein